MKKKEFDRIKENELTNRYTRDKKQEQEEKSRREKMILNLMKDPVYRPMKLKELAMLLQVPRESRHELEEVLNHLLSEGKISLSAKGKYADAGHFSHVGTLTVTSRGFGFVTIEGMEEDIFIPKNAMGSAMEKDTVKIQILQEVTGKRREGRVTAVVSRGITELVGTFQKNKSFGFVIPDNQRITTDIFVPFECSMGAKQGDKVLVAIDSYGTAKKSPEGHVKEIFGNLKDPGTDIYSIARSFEIPMDFPVEVLEEVEKIPGQVLPEEAEQRLDYRQVLTVTIDGEDAKDLDDAISLHKEEGRYFLGVHIADVTHYVREDAPLDREALHRGTSVYLLDRVIPMLPKELSNGICSLNAGEERLALSCLMELDEKGKMISHQIAETVIRVDARMNYTDVAAILEKEDAALCEKYEGFVPMFRLMKELSLKLREIRGNRGAINFDFPEAKITLNEKGYPTEIKPYERNCAMNIIEDFMLLANETIAEDFFWQQLPFVYRIHEEPDEEKIRKFQLFVANFGYHIHFKDSRLRPGELSKLLDKIEGTDVEPMLSRMMLRSMKQAKYSVENAGHFGLSAKYYCHFTSPIRRYPDLQIHRIIKENLNGGLKPERMEHYEYILPEVASESSRLERRAEEAEREVEKRKKVQYMSRHIGEGYTGVISGVTQHGFYVELPNTIEGMVHVSNLDDDYYSFKEEEMALVGQMRGKEYRLGQTVAIRVLSTDIQALTIDFYPDTM